MYRDAAKGNAAAAQPLPTDDKFDFERTITPDPVLLFRYSALTFNGHRIHYDRDYASETESYPGLVVHGPLLATLLLELFTEKHPQAVLSGFEFKATQPVFDIADFQVCGTKLDDSGVRSAVGRRQRRESLYASQRTSKQSMTDTPPLQGITVVSLEHAIAAPLCTRQLAELGAQVIKVERRGTGDFARHYDDRVKGQSSHFIWTNRSKKSLTLDSEASGLGPDSAQTARIRRCAGAKPGARRRQQDGARFRAAA